MPSASEQQQGPTLGERVARGRVKVLDRENRFLFWATDEEARDFIRAGAAEVIARSGTGRIRARPPRKSPGGDPSWMLSSHFPSAFERCARRERRELLTAVMHRLSIRARRLLQLRYACGRTFPECANAMHATDGAMEKMHARALQTLRAALSECGVQTLRQLI